MMRVFPDRRRSFGRPWDTMRPVRREPTLPAATHDRHLSIGRDGQLYRAVNGTWVNVSLLGER